MRGLDERGVLVRGGGALGSATGALRVTYGTPQENAIGSWRRSARCSEVARARVSDRLDGNLRGLLQDNSDDYEPTAAQHIRAAHPALVPRGLRRSSYCAWRFI